MTLDREYFEMDNPNYGFRNEGYRDFGVHHVIANDILNVHPKSVLDIGGARGYVCKILKNSGVDTMVMDKSEHCYHTRAIDKYYIHDACETPYSELPDHAFDLIFSNAFMEHIEPDKLDGVIREMGRISDRSFHMFPMADTQPYDVFKGDTDHKIYQSSSWWIDKFKELAPNHKTKFFSADQTKYYIASTDEPQLKTVERAHNNGYYFVPREEMFLNGEPFVKLNLGCGYDMIYYGWINMDTRDMTAFANINKFAYLDLHDLNRIDESTVDLIFSQQLMGSAFSYDEALSHLKTCYKLLKSESTIKLCAVDAHKIFDSCISRRSVGLKHIIPGIDDDITTMDNVSTLFKDHKVLWDETTLGNIMIDAGFTSVKRVSPFESRSNMIEKQTIVKYPTVTLCMEGVK